MGVSTAPRDLWDSFSLLQILNADQQTSLAKLRPTKKKLNAYSNRRGLIFQHSSSMLFHCWKYTIRMVNRLLSGFWYDVFLSKLQHTEANLFVGRKFESGFCNWLCCWHNLYVRRLPRCCPGRLPEFYRYSPLYLYDWGSKTCQKPNRKTTYKILLRSMTTFFTGSAKPLNAKWFEAAEAPQENPQHFK